ncbi:MAG: hypothetical protein ACYC5X_04765 [Syntrophales bacterium]
MKKLLVVLLSLGLIAAFSMTASAATVNFSGAYYVVGVYANNPALINTDNTHSRANYWQRLRLQPVFQIAEGLSLTTRMDAMEKGWGSTDWKGNFDDANSSRKEIPAYTSPKAQENFEFERGYVTFMTKIGQFDIGYQSSGKWGTDFLDNETTRPRVKLTTKAGPVVIVALLEKQFEASQSSQAGYAGTVDTDNDNYAVGAIYNFKGGNAGLLYKFTNNRATRLASKGSYASKLHYLAPYMKATFGPVYVEAELDWLFGKAAKFEAPSTSADKDTKSYAAYVKARMNVGPAYFGGAFQWIPGQDPNENDKEDWTNGSGAGSQDLDVGIYLGNDALQTWKGGGSGAGGNFTFDSAKFNSIIGSVFGGFNPTPKLNVQALIAYAQLDKIEAPAAFNQNDSKKLGTEFDVTASYKIYDNLTYMVGAAYFWTGDAFKGFGANSANNSVGNDYLLLNRIALSF